MKPSRPGQHVDAQSDARGAGLDFPERRCFAQVVAEPEAEQPRALGAAFHAEQKHTVMPRAREGLPEACPSKIIHGGAVRERD